MNADADPRFQLRGSGSSDVLIMSTASVQILLSKCHALLKEPGLLEEMADFRAGPGKGQFEVEHLFVPKDKELFKE